MKTITKKLNIETIIKILFFAFLLFSLGCVLHTVFTDPLLIKRAF